MKEAIGGISLFQIVITLIILFTGFICLSINYNKAFSIKNELLTVIKNQGGVCVEGNSMCQSFSELVKEYLLDMNYHSSGRCGDGWVGYTRDGKLADYNSRAAFCVKGIRLGTDSSELSNALYYKVKVFFQIDLPILGGLFNFDVNGETSRISTPNECTYDRLKYGWC